MTTIVPKKIARTAKKMAARNPTAKLDVKALLAPARVGYLTAVAVLARKYANALKRGVEHDRNVPANVPIGDEDPRKKPFLWEFSYSLRPLPMCRDKELARFVLALSRQLERPFARNGGVDQQVDDFTAAWCLAGDIVESAVEQGLIEKAEGKLLLRTREQ